ncbi:MAG: hypothetical protein IJR61_02575, partial [Clostridia bacterium]|nr:hypothetical protein [Clostridia bacterium]
GFKGKIYFAFNESNFTYVGGKTLGEGEAPVFPETVEKTMTVLINKVNIEEGTTARFSLDGAETGWQSASEVTPILPNKELKDFNLKELNLAETNPLDEDSIWIHFTKQAKGNCYIEVDLDKEDLGTINTSESLGVAIRVGNPKTANRPLNLRFYDADGEIFTPSSASPVYLVSGSGSVTTAEIRNTKEIRIPGQTYTTVLVPWSCLTFFNTTKGSATGEIRNNETTVPVNGKLGECVKMAVVVYPDQPAPSELEWIIGDIALISKEDGTITKTFDLTPADWRVSGEVEENITVVEGRPAISVSYEVNIPEGILDIALSAEKVYYPYGETFLHVIADEGYEVSYVTLNGDLVDKSGANTYSLPSDITGATAKFEVVLKVIETEGDDTGIPAVSAKESSGNSGCKGGIAVESLIFAVAGLVGAAMMRKRREV